MNLQQNLFVLALLMSTLLNAASAQSAPAAANWKQVLEHAPFEPRDSAGELVFNDRMWIIGGYLPSLNDDVWSSADGIEWRHEGKVGAKGGVNIPVNFVFKDQMWVSSNAGELFASSDGKNWKLVNATPPWAGRYAAGGTVFKNKIWVLGGQSQKEDKSLFNDVWSSEDGVTWTRVLEHAPWSPRQLFSNVVAKDDKLWIIGGGITRYDPFEAYQDVWNSSDGVHWEKVLDKAPWPARIWSTCIVYHEYIFLLGGFQDQPRLNFNDVWYSRDGKEWTQLKTQAIWKERHETSVLDFNDKLWVIAGMGWPLVNDVWSLELPRDFK